MPDSSVTIQPGVNVDTRTENINNDQREVVVIGDPVQGSGVAPVDATNGLSVTLTTAVPAGTNNIGDIDVVSLPALATGSNAIGRLAANAGVNIGTVDIASNTNMIPGVAATNLGKAEDAAHTSGDVGVMALAVRNDSGSVLAGTTGDYVPLTTDSTGALRATGGTQFASSTTNYTSADAGTLMLAVRRAANATVPAIDGAYTYLQTDNLGALKVAITSGAGSGGTSLADEAAFTPGVTSFTPVGGIYETSADTLTNNQAAALAVDVNRNLKVTLATLLGGEDITNNLIGTLPKAIAASTYSPSTYAPLTQINKAAIKGSTGNVLALYFTNEESTPMYLQLHNKATAPAAGEAPLYSFKVGAGSTTTPTPLELGTEFFTQAGKNFTTGIGFAISTTLGTFTDAAATLMHSVFVHYV